MAVGAVSFGAVCMTTLIVSMGCPKVAPAMPAVMPLTNDLQGASDITGEVERSSSPITIKIELCALDIKRYTRQRLAINSNIFHCDKKWEKEMQRN